MSPGLWDDLVDDDDGDHDFVDDIIHERSAQNPAFPEMVEAALQAREIASPAPDPPPALTSPARRGKGQQKRLEQPRFQQVNVRAPGLAPAQLAPGSMVLFQEKHYRIYKQHAVGADDAVELVDPDEWEQHGAMAPRRFAYVKNLHPPSA